MSTAPRAPTAAEIRDRIRELIAQHTGTALETINPEASIWDSFPPNPSHGEHPSVGAFLNQLQSEYQVYLREEDVVEDPTLTVLAYTIREKVLNPELSVRHLEEERRVMQKSRTYGLWTIGIIVLVMVVATKGSPGYKLLVGGGVMLVLTAAFLLRLRSDRQRKAALDDITPE